MKCGCILQYMTDLFFIFIKGCVRLRARLSVGGRLWLRVRQCKDNVDVTCRLH